MSSGGLFVSRTIAISTVFRGSSVDSVGRIPSRTLSVLETRRRWRITSSLHRGAVTVMVGVSVAGRDRATGQRQPATRSALRLRSGQTQDNPVMDILRHPTYVRNIRRGRIPCLRTAIEQAGASAMKRENPPVPASSGFDRIADVGQVSREGDRLILHQLHVEPTKGRAFGQ